MQKDTSWLAKPCYWVLQSGQRNLLKKTAVTANTHVFRICSNFLLLFARHIGVLMLYYTQGDILQLNSTTARNISFPVRYFQEVKQISMYFLTVKIL